MGGRGWGGVSCGVSEFQCALSGLSWLLKWSYSRYAPKILILTSSGARGRDCVCICTHPGVERKPTVGLGSHMADEITDGLLTRCG